MSRERIKQREPREERVKKKLEVQKKLTQAEIGRAMTEASRAIDRLGAENAGLRRIVVAERAQVIYYTEQAIAFAERKTLDLVLKAFQELTDEQREAYVKRAIVELEGPAEPPAIAEPGAAKKAAGEVKLVQ
jgi:uncharacterized membrane protein